MRSPDGRVCTKEDYEEIKTLKMSGMKATDICIETGWSRSTVEKCLQLLGLSKDNHARRSDRFEEARHKEWAKAMNF